MDNDFLIINNVRVPTPAPGMSIDSAVGVNAGRNADNEVVGQVVGRRQYKINNLAWRGLTESQVKTILGALDPFYVPVTFRDVDGTIRTVTMYPGDTSGKPLKIKDLKYALIEELRFNLIDCGWND
jgi:hypothetical protein